MIPLILYLIKVNVALALLYMFYKLSFTKDTFFGLRRLMLILIYITAFAYPFIDFSGWVTSPEANNGLVTVYNKIMPEVVIVYDTPGKVIDYSWLLGMATFLYLAGVAVLLIRTLLELVKIRQVLHCCLRIIINGTTVCVLPEVQEPYSFFKWIHIHPEIHTDKELKEILIHEQTHVREHHSIDILLAQLTIILCWFNPFVWLIRREIRMNHEYLADKHVIASGYDKKSYQYHLIGMEHHSLAAANLYNNFSVLPLKKRIKMLNKKRTRNIMKSKYLMFLPVAALLMLFSNCGNKTNSAQDTTEVKDTTSVVQTPKEVVAEPMADATTTSATVEGEVFEVVEHMPEFPGGQQACLQYLAKNIEYPVAAQDAKEQGRVIVQMVVTKEGKVADVKVVKGVSETLNKEAMRVVSSMPQWKPGKQRGVAVNVKYTLPVMFKLQ